MALKLEVPSQGTSSSCHKLSRMREYLQGVVREGETAGLKTRARNEESPHDMRGNRRRGEIVSRRQMARIVSEEIEKSRIKCGDNGRRSA